MACNGAAVNEGRALFAGDKEFGQWITANSLRQLAGQVEAHAALCNGNLA